MQIESEAIPKEILQDMKQKFSLGIKLKEFAIYTTDETYVNRIVKQEQKKVETERDKLTYKVARLDGLSIFCNWRDVDEPENGHFDKDYVETLSKESKDKFLKNFVDQQFSPEMEQVNFSILKELFIEL